MKYLLSIICLFSGLIFYSCKPKYHVKIGDAYIEEVLEYKGSVTKINDLVDTKLELEPDFDKKELKGTATITLKPHFYSTDSLTLNAKYMRIIKVALITKPSGESKTTSTTPLEYSYDSLLLRIKLNKTYIKDETYIVSIEYVAQPEKCKGEGGSAITEDKGIYFINTDGEDENKPVQVWTQGETEAASCWFPTIDAPNQKTTEDIYVTVPSEYRTISNGLLLSSDRLSDNKRKDHWHNDKPHAPYLFALVIGNFTETKDHWRNINVNYYMEPAFAQYTKMVFGNTPKMLEFYSNTLNYPYPWPKFDQVVVRDFVSGAMENTGCVVHFDKLNHNSREHLDNTYEDVVAHELFHHWFGDLVTCESWSNIPLNESFATYGEYLWNEHMYGRNQADLKFNEFLSYYFNEAEDKQVPMIRFHYSKRDELFDRHSYQKGGAILHMLRKYLGDEAFFKSLNLYLNQHAYKTAEINDLRMSFEEVTGEDLNWFFNQWFMESGHPELEVKHQTYNGSGELYGITVLQKSKWYKLPVDVDVYTSKGIERHRIIIDKDSQTFGLKCESKPLCVIFDAEHQLLAQITETKSIQAWEAQLKHAKLAVHQSEALSQLNNLQKDKVQVTKYNQKFLNDSFWKLREDALNNINSLDLTDEEIKPILTDIRQIANYDTKSDVRVATIPFFENLKDEDQLGRMLYDSSYNVCSRALQALGNVNKLAAYTFANKNREEGNNTFQDYIYYTIGRYSTKNEIDFFIGRIRNGDEKTAYNAIGGLNFFVIFNQIDKLDDALQSLDNMASNTKTKKRAIDALTEMRSAYENQLYYQSIYKLIDKKNKAEYVKIGKLLEIRKKKVEAILIKYGETLND